MKRKTAVILIIIVIILAFVAAVCVSQRDNIAAIFNGLFTSGDEISQKLEDNHGKLGETVKTLLSSLGIDYDSLTEEQKQKLSDGSLTENEVIGILLGTADTGEQQTQPPEVTSSPAETDGPDTTSPPASSAAQTTTAVTTAPPSTTDADAASKARIAVIVSQLYGMKASYTAKLEEIKDTALAEYMALPEEEKTSAVKKKMYLDCFDKATALERQCDDTVFALTDELKELLAETGGDTSLASSILYSYVDEKSLIKAYYIDLYTKNKS